MTGPFSFFDQIYCTRFDAGETRWNAFAARLSALGIAERVTAVRVDPRVVDWQVSLALTHRRVLEKARACDAEAVLVLEENALLLSDAPAHMARIGADLRAFATRGETWTILYLGAATWAGDETSIAGSDHLATCAGASGTHALAYHRSGIERLLDALPADIPHLGDWTARYETFDRFLATLPGRLLARPRIASLPELLPYEDPALREAYFD